MHEFHIECNRFLTTKRVLAYHNTYYRGYRQPGNPDYLNTLKNTFGNESPDSLWDARKQLSDILKTDLPRIRININCNSIYVCVVPRAKAECIYSQIQLYFKKTVQDVVQNMEHSGLIDGTDFIRRHTNTRTTHLRREIQNYNNDGLDPYPGITEETCDISEGTQGKNILLIDDIYTPGVNIDEDAIQALFAKGANSVVFYAIAKTQHINHLG